MTDARRHLAQRRKLARLHQFGLRAAQLFVGVRQRARPLLHPAFQAGVRLGLDRQPVGQRAAPFHQREDDRAQPDRGQRDHRGHQPRLPFGGGDVDQCLARHLDHRQGPGQVHGAFGQVRAARQGPDVIAAKARRAFAQTHLTGHRGQFRCRLIGAEAGQDQLIPVRHEGNAALIGEEDDHRIAAPRHLDRLGRDPRDQRTGDRAIGGKDRRGVDEQAVACLRLDLAREAQRALHRAQEMRLA